MCYFLPLFALTEFFERRREQQVVLPSSIYCECCIKSSKFVKTNIMSVTLVKITMIRTTYTT